MAGQTWPKSTTYAITWGRLDGILIPMSKIFTTSTINWERVDGIKRPVSMILLSQRHFNTFYFRNFIIVVTMAGVIIDGLTRQRS